MIDFLIERTAAKVSGDIAERLESRGITWEMLTDAYNAVSNDGHCDTEYIKEAIFSGKITLKELTIILSILSSKPLISVAPLSRYDEMQAKRFYSS